MSTVNGNINFYYNLHCVKLSCPSHCFIANAII